MKFKFRHSSLWSVLCSLKVTIVLASAATLVTIGGSLSIPGNPQHFSMMDKMPLGVWLNEFYARAPLLSWWIPLVAVLILLLALNTFCCFIDWLMVFRSRWRKSGEYLIHLGFVLLVIAYLWGSLAGSRREGNQIYVGQTLPLSEPGTYLRLEAFQPILGPGGRPMDMLNTLVLLRGDTELTRAQVRINHPLLWQGLVILPASFGRTFVGYQQPAPGSSRGEAIFKTYSVLTINYDPGANLALAGGVAMGTGILLTLVSFYRKRVRGDRPDVC